VSHQGHDLIEIPRIVYVTEDGPVHIVLFVHRLGGREVLAIEHHHHITAGLANINLMLPGLTGFAQSLMLGVYLCPGIAIVKHLLRRSYGSRLPFNSAVRKSDLHVVQLLDGSHFVHLVIAEILYYQVDHRGFDLIIYLFSNSLELHIEKICQRVIGK